MGVAWLAHFCAHLVGPLGWPAWLTRLVGPIGCPTLLTCSGGLLGWPARVARAGGPPGWSAQVACLGHSLESFAGRPLGLHKIPYKVDM